MRFTATRSTIKKLQEKVKWARYEGNAKMLIKYEVILFVALEYSYEQIQEITQVGLDTIRVFMNKFLVGGISSLEGKRSSGRPSKLLKSQKKELREILINSPLDYGFSSGCWNAAMIQILINEKFGVLYAVKYIANLLKNLGFSYQKAKFESGYLNEQKRADWLNETFPKILRKAKKKNSYLLFGDECSFPMWGSLSYTWGLIGVQPTIKTSGKRTACKVFGMIDYFTGKFFNKLITGKFNTESYTLFINEIISSTRKHIFLIQDGARYHTSKEANKFFKENKSRLTVYQMPSYSPDYNPIEILWKKIKKDGIHLNYFPTLEDLMDKVQIMLLHYQDRSSKFLDFIRSDMFEKTP